MKRLSILAVVAILAASPSAFAAETVNVDISNFTFNPPEITVHAGTTVAFKNSDDIPHLVVASDGSFRSKALDTGDVASIAFAKAGTFAYFCGLHPHMQGKVVVLP